MIEKCGFSTYGQVWEVEALFLEPWNCNKNWLPSTQNSQKTRTDGQMIGWLTLFIVSNKLLSWASICLYRHLP